MLTLLMLLSQTPKERASRLGLLKLKPQVHDSDPLRGGINCVGYRSRNNAVPAVQ
jgi:hypothetical protein